MAKSKNNAKKLSYISVPSQIIKSSSLQSLIENETPKKSARTSKFFTIFTKWRNPRLFFFTFFLFLLFAILKFGFNSKIPFSPYPCATTLSNLSISNGQLSKSELDVDSSQKDEFEFLISNVQLQAKGPSGVEKKDEENSVEVEKSEFWKQPDGLGYRPCLDFSRDYRRGSEWVLKNRRKYLMVVVSGGMNQQRNQIVDAVVIARILGASLVVPILQVNVIWGDER